MDRFEDRTDHRVDMEINCPSTTIGVEDEEEQEKNQNSLSYFELYKAVEAGNCKKFDAVLDKACLRNGKLISRKDMLEKTCSLSPKKNTWLHVAASHGKEAMEIIIHIFGIYEKDSDQLLKKKNVDGDTVLHVAARAGHHPTVEALLIMNCDHLCLNNKGNQPLHEALNNNRPDVARCLINHDLRFPLVVNGEGESALYLAIKSNDAQTVRLILDKYNELYSTASGRSLDDNYDHRSRCKPLLILAIESGNKEILVMLVESKIGSLLLAKDKEGKTALHWAAFRGYIPEMLYLLSKCESAALIQDNDGSFPIHSASSKGHLEIVHKLHSYCSNSSELVNNKGQNFVHVAASHGKDIIVLYALRNDSRKLLINLQDNDGNTPLHLAVNNCHHQIVSILVSYHKIIDFNKENKEGKTALDVVVISLVANKSFSFGTEKIVTELMNVKAKPSYNYEVFSTGNINVDDDNRINTIVTYLIYFATTAYLSISNMDSNMIKTPHPTLGHDGNQFQASITFNIIVIFSVITIILRHMWVIVRNPQRRFNFLNHALGLIAICIVSFSIAIILYLHQRVAHVKWQANLVILTGSIFLVFLVVHIIDFFCPILSYIKLVWRVKYSDFQNSHVCKFVN